MSRIAFLATFFTGALDTGADLHHVERVQVWSFRCRIRRFRFEVSRVQVWSVRCLEGSALVCGVEDMGLEGLGLRV